MTHPTELQSVNDADKSADNDQQSKATEPTGKLADPMPRCASCDGERVLWLMSEFPVPCPDCNPNSPQFRKATGAEGRQP